MPLNILNILGLIIVVFILFLFLPLAFGAPFQPSSKKRVRIITEIAKIKEGERVAELGSGNGKLVIALAKTGAEVHGYEINPVLILWSRWKIKKLGLEKKAFVHWKNFWKVDLKKFDVIILFQVYYIMRKLGNKIKKEAKKGTRVVSNTWKFPGKKPVKKISHVYLYKF